MRGTSVVECCNEAVARDTTNASEDSTALTSTGYLAQAAWLMIPDSIAVNLSVDLVKANTVNYEQLAAIY